MMRLRAILPMLALLSAAPLPSDDAGVVRAALIRVGGDRDTVRCVTPHLIGRPFEDMRRNMAGSPDILAVTPEVRKTVARQWVAQEHWIGADDLPLTGAQRDALNDAVVSLLLADPFPPPPSADEAVGELNGTDGTPATPEPVADGPAISPDLLRPGQQLQPTRGCLSVTLSNVVRHGDLAFVDIGIVGGPLSGSGEQWAFRRDGAGWRWIAGHQTWIS